MMESGVAIPKTVVVGSDASNKIPFNELSVTGKIVNAYNALLIADKMSK
jgi:hypothetical protein